MNQHAMPSRAVLQIPTSPQSGGSRQLTLEPPKGHVSFWGHNYHCHSLTPSSTPPLIILQSFSSWNRDLSPLFLVSFFLSFSPPPWLLSTSVTPTPPCGGTRHLPVWPGSLVRRIPRFIADIHDTLSAQTGVPRRTHSRYSWSLRFPPVINYIVSSVAGMFSTSPWRGRKGTVAALSSWLSLLFLSCPLTVTAKSASDYYVPSLPGAPDGPLLKMHAG